MHCQRVSELETALSSCQSDLSARDDKLSKLRSLLSRLTKQSDDHKNRLAAHQSERHTLLRCIDNYRQLMSLPWSTLAACTATATSVSSASSPGGSLTPPLSSPSSPPLVSSSPPSAAFSVIDDSLISDSSAAGSVSPQSPSPLDDAVDVDDCHPVLRVTLNDCTHWLLLSTRRNVPTGAAASVLVQQQQCNDEHSDGDGEAGEEAPIDRTAHTVHSLTSTAWRSSAQPFASSSSVATRSASLPTLSATSSSSATSDQPAGRAARRLFWSDLSVYLSFKWKKYQTAAKQNTAPFAVLQSSAHSATSSTADDTSTPGPSSPLATFASLLSPSSSLSCSLLLFDGAHVPADCLSLLASSLSSIHSSAVSRLRALHAGRVSVMTSAVREAEQSHESVVRDFSRYQQRTRELLGQKQRQLDELLGRDEEADGLRSSLSALTAQLDALNRDKSSQATSLVSLAQQLQACQADKERALMSERHHNTALSAVQADLRALKEATEAQLAHERQRAQQAEEAAQRMARQMDEVNRRAAVVAVAATQQLTSQTTTEPHSAFNVTGNGASGDVQQQLVSVPHSSADALPSPAAALSSSPPLTVTVPDSPSLSFLSSADGSTVDDSSSMSLSGELASVRTRVRALQSLVQQREIALVQLQSTLDASTVRCRSLESDLALLRSMESGSSNVEYLRNVFCRFLATSDDSLIPVLCTLLNVDKQQQLSIQSERARSTHSHGRARQTSGASAPATAPPPSFFTLF